MIYVDAALSGRFGTAKLAENEVHRVQKGSAEHPPKETPSKVKLTNEFTVSAG